MATIPSQQSSSNGDKFSPKSSFIELAEYNAQSRMMTLTFKNGTQYNYLNMFESTWLSFKQADNHSVYYSRAIKGRVASVPVKRTAIGKKPQKPLKQININRSLKTYGLDIGNASKRPTRQLGNIPSAFGK